MIDIEIQPYELPHRNPQNKWLKQSDVEAILRKFGISESINSLELYQRAFIHQSFIVTDRVKQNEIDLSEYSREQINSWKSTIPMQTDSYERLECLGDKVLGLTITDYLFHRFPKQEPGFITKIYIALTKGENLAKLTGRLKWGQYLMLSRSHESHRYTDTAYLEDVFESFIGAIYLDFGGRQGNGFAVASGFIIRVIEKFLNLSQIIYRDDNYKDLLLQYYHKTFDGRHPCYKTLSIKDRYNRRMYTCGVLNIDDIVIVQASDPKKVRAEQLASREALKYFGEPVCESEDEDDYFSDSDE